MSSRSFNFHNQTVRSAMGPTHLKRGVRFGVLVVENRPIQQFPDDFSGVTNRRLRLFIQVIERRQFFGIDRQLLGVQVLHRQERGT